MARYAIDVACISETHLTNIGNLKITGYKVYRHDRNCPHASGGVSIIIRQKLVHSESLSLITQNIESVAIKILTHDQTYINIIAVYKPPNKPLLESDINTLFHSNETTLVIGDMNSKNTAWGCRQTNPSGNKLLDSSPRYGYLIGAPDEFTYFPYRSDHAPDILDIVIHKKFSKPIQLDVITELNSDRLPILITFSTTPIVRNLEPRLIKGIINWDQFQKQSDKNFKLSKIPQNEEDIDKTIEAIKKCITKSINESTIKTKRCRKRNFDIPPNYILELIRKKSQLRRKWQRTRDSSLKNEINNLTHKIKRELENYKIQSYQKYISNIDNNDHSLWVPVKRILRQPPEISTIKTNDNEFATDEEKCIAFTNHLEKVFTTENLTPNHFATQVLNHIESHTPSTEDFYSPTSPQEI